MVIAGAGGHALELLDILLIDNLDEEFYFYDDKTGIKLFEGRYPIIDNINVLEIQFSKDPRFILGTGNPFTRKYFFDLFTSLGGKLNNVKGKNTSFSNFYINNQSDIFSLCFIGAKTCLGLGSLINTGAQIHHEVFIGEFSEVNPGAVILGKAQVGNFSSIGANVTVLPKIKIGNNVIIGAGSVITENIPDNVLVVGVPGKIIKKI